MTTRKHFKKCERCKNNRGMGRYRLDKKAKDGRVKVCKTCDMDMAGTLPAEVHRERT